MSKHVWVSALGAVTVAAVMAMPANADDIEATVQSCSQCHGQGGEPTDPKTIPIIWGQEANYLYKELHDFHSGDRKSPIMAPVVHDISLKDLRKVAAYFAAKTWPVQHTGPAAAPPPASVAEKIAMCRACHQQNFEGGAPAPRIAGLSYDYLVAAMRAFADGERTNNLDMPKFMHTLSDSDRDAIARYLSTL